MKTLDLREFEFASVEGTDLLRNGRLDIYPEVERRDFFDIRLSSQATEIQARGWIGTIPINDELTLHVKPRVNVGNLDRMIAVSECQYRQLTHSLRRYEYSGYLYPALVSMYSDALCDGIETIFRQGLLKDYQRREAITSIPRGRVLVGPTLMLAEGRKQRHRAVTTWFQRTSDTAVNQCLLFAVHRLAIYNQQFSGGLPVAEVRRNARRLNHASQLLGGVTLDPARHFLFDPIVKGTTQLPTVRDYYRDPLDLAKTIVAGHAVSISDSGGSVRLPSLLINMSDVFEAYLRNVLRVAAVAEGWPLRVLDGNNAPGRKPLLDEGLNIAAKPDIVLRTLDHGMPHHPVLAEVKYKPARQQPKREDLDQTLAYGVSYRAENVVVIQPRDPAGLTSGLHWLGRLADIQIWMYVFDTGFDPLQTQEHAFSNSIRDLALTS